MNAFYEHHKDSIRFGYRCFDRLLLNGLIQPFQQPERVIGFFNTYRQVYPVSRDVLREIAEQFQNWVVNRSQKWGAPILEEPKDRRDKFLDPYFRKAKPNQIVAINALNCGQKWLAAFTPFFTEQERKHAGCQHR